MSSTRKYMSATNKYRVMIHDTDGAVISVFDTPVPEYLLDSDMYKLVGVQDYVIHYRMEAV